MIHLYKDNYLFEHKSSSTSKENFINHIHFEWELYYLVDGSTDFFINGSVYDLKPGDLLLIKPAAFHFATPAKNKVYERIVINFPNSHAAPFNDEKFEQSVFFFHLPENSPIQTLLHSISYAVKNFNADDAFLSIKSLLDAILVQLKYYQNSTNEVPQPHIVNTLLENVLEYIENNPTKALTLESIAKHFFISISWLTHTFKQHLDVTPKQYINYKKILYSQQLILAGTAPSEVYTIIGYNDYSTFFRQYKKTLKRSPKEDYLNRRSKL